jgi:hypothetical protein
MNRQWRAGPTEPRSMSGRLPPSMARRSLGAGLASAKPHKAVSLFSATAITFDVTNRSLLAVRIVLGSLFGVFLSMPFGFYSFVTFWDSLAHGTPTLGATNFSFETALLLLPFVLGLSTSLVILVLNRFVESITFFLEAAPAPTAAVKRFAPSLFGD